MKGRHEGIKKEEIDNLVDDQIERAIEQLQDHVRPTLQGYENFLHNQLKWVEMEKDMRKSLSEPPPL